MRLPYTRAKRLLDLGIATAALVLSSPILVLVAIVVRCTLGRPVLFRQQRAGLYGRPFTIFKFRTMTHVADALPCTDANRLTRTGKLLRSTSLDELPQLLNVLRGEMSLVGPRPLLTQYLTRYTPLQARRHEVRPGLTGWAQVNGRNVVTWETRLAMDVWYVDNRSLSLDFKILARTVATILSRQGISARGEATMPEFLGSNQ